MFALRWARRLSPGVGSHPDRPFRTPDRGAVPDFVGRAATTVETVKPSDFQHRHRRVPHCTQLLRFHSSRVPPDPITIGTQLGAKFQLLRVRHRQGGRARGLPTPCHLTPRRHQDRLECYPRGAEAHPDRRGSCCDALTGGSACSPRWCCGRAVARGTPQAPGSSRQLLCRRLRTRDPSRKPSFFPESSRRCPNNARRPGFEAAALVTISIRTCSCCPPIRPAASTDCRIRGAT
jgi:hypothetical protein